ncbi:MAG: MBL fold metallo-hydrolase [Rikenellaceae bacterium]
MMATITILVDNSSSPYNGELEYEHGFSAFIEFNGASILCDMGVESIYSSNAQRLGVNLNNLDAAFISHAHRDHLGGLNHFLENFNSNVYLSPHCFNRRYFSLRHEQIREIGIESSIIHPFSSRIKFVDNSCWLTNSIAIVRRSTQNSYSKPLANRFLTMQSNDSQQTNDTFEHELSLVLKDRDGIIIISPCSHMGAMNIIESCKQFTSTTKVKAFIGGLHLVDSEQSAEECETFYQELISNSPETKIFTGHCTGQIAKDTLKRLMGEQIEFFHTGAVIAI